MTVKQKKKFEVLVVGELNIDLILNRIEGFPALSKEIIANDMTVTLGSSSAIFANNLSALGTNVSFLGKVGNDHFADQVCESLQKSGVDISHIQRSAKFQTGLTVAMNYDNDRAMVTYPGAMNDLTLSDISENVLESGKHLHLSSVFLQKGIKSSIVDLFRSAKEKGLTTSLDPQWDPDEKWDLDLNSLLPLVDIFLPNEEELKQLTGLEHLEDAMDSIAPFSNMIVVKRGIKGALMRKGEETVAQDAFLNPAVVDAIGAGDSFNSGFIHKYIQEATAYECLRFAALTGAINTTAAGGTDAFSSRDKIMAVAKESFNFSIS